MSVNFGLRIAQIRELLQSGADYNGRGAIPILSAQLDVGSRVVQAAVQTPDFGYLQLQPEGSTSEF
jgi:hypothetical protein